MLIKSLAIATISLSILVLDLIISDEGMDGENFDVLCFYIMPKITNKDYEQSLKERINYN